jgi:hypothetical protein
MVSGHLLCPFHPPLLSHKRTFDTLESTKWHRVVHHSTSFASKKHSTPAIMSGANTTPGHVAFGRSAPSSATPMATGTFIATTATVWTPEGGASSGSLFSALDLMKSAHMTHLSNAVSQSTRKHRVGISKAMNHFRPKKACVDAESSPQNKRSDSGLELVSPPTQPESVSRQEQEARLLSALPANVRAEIPKGAFARNEPVDFVKYSNPLDFNFDLRTANGVSDFHAWHANLGTHACRVTSLTLKHWTTYWSFNNNAWITSEDSTHFARGSQGDLIMFRAMLPTASETCDCGLPYLLAQHDQEFDLKRFREISNTMNFINCLRDGRWLSRVDAASTFASMLDEHSQLLFQDYKRSGSSCSGCFTQRLYLTGHLSTSASEGSDVVFNALALQTALDSSVRACFSDSKLRT